MNNKFFFVILSFVTTVTTYAETRKYSNEFLNIGVGARGLGMSSAIVASSNDVTSGYWNPACLTEVTGNIQLAGMHAQYFAGIANYDYMGLAARIDKQSVIGASYIRFAVDNIPNTLEIRDANGNIDYDKIQSFSVADNAFLLSYARQTNIKGLSFGANAKVIRRTVGEFGGAWGFGLDAGVKYKYKEWIFAAMGRDITTTINNWTYNTEKFAAVFQQTGNEVIKQSSETTMPRALLAAARNVKIYDQFSANIELDLDVTFDGKRNVPLKSNVASADPHIGVELDYAKIVFVRAGIGKIQQATNQLNKNITTIEPTMGVGFKVPKLLFMNNLHIDYALTNIGDNTKTMYSNIFSLKFDINQQKP